MLSIVRYRVKMIEDKTLFDNNVDITEFIKKGNTRIVSDPEGCDIYRLAFPEKVDKKSNVLVCGDILDSTFTGPVPSEHLDKYSNNLKNIITLHFNRDKYKLIIGNRDINKIKVYPLTQLVRALPEPGHLTPEQEIDLQLLIEEFNNGTLSVNYDNYMNLKNFSTFETANFNAYYPYWQMTPENVNSGKNWNYQNQDSFLQRYYNIFGADNNKPNDKTGTISAQNTLDGFYHELKKYHRNLKRQEERVPEEERENFRAFTVLAVYRSLLFPSSFYCPDDKIKNLNTACYRGLLYNLLRNSYVNAYSYLNNKFVMYSHGGIVRETNLRLLYDAIIQDNYAILSDFEAYKTQYGNQSGGFYKETDNVVDIEEFKNTLQLNQKTYKMAFESTTLKAGPPDINMRFILSIAVPLKSKKLFGSRATDDIDLTKLSPIQVNFDNVRDGFFFLKDKSGNIIETIQIFGHIPSGFSNVIDYYEYSGDLKESIKQPIKKPVLPSAPLIAEPLVSPIKPTLSREEIEKELKERKEITDFDNSLEMTFNNSRIQELERMLKESQSKYQQGGNNTSGWAICIDTTMTHTHSRQGIDSKQGIDSYNYLTIDSNHTIVSKGHINLSNMTKGKLELNAATGTLGNEDPNGNVFKPSHHYYSSTDMNEVHIEETITSEIGEMIKQISKDDFIINVHKTGENTVLMIKHPKTAGLSGGFNKMLLILNKADIQQYLK